jgi:3-oxoacyl-[acyl-carrier-protein] synthase II
LRGVKTFYKPEAVAEIEARILAFLEGQDCPLSEIDFILTGNNGDPKNDAVYRKLENSVFLQKKTISFKQYCGDYPTAGAFALWLATTLIEKQEMSIWTGNDQGNIKPIRNILIYNHFQQIHHSLILISAC